MKAGLGIQCAMGTVTLRFLIFIFYFFAAPRGLQELPSVRFLAQCRPICPMNLQRHLLWAGHSASTEDGPVNKTDQVCPPGAYSPDAKHLKWVTPERIGSLRCHFC